MNSISIPRPKCQGTSCFLAEGGGRGRCPLGFVKGGDFEVKEGHPDFLQIA